MKLKYLIFLILFGIMPFSAFSQSQEGGLGFTSWIKDNPSGLNSDNIKALQVKINQIIARNGAGSTSALSTLFVIYPEFIITREDVIESGIKPTSVIRAELTLFAVNKADMSNYGSVVLSIQGNGNNKDAAIRSMISRIQPTNSKFAKFISSARKKIIDYYSAQMPSILAKVNSLVERQQYQDALVLLSMIPECMDNYPDIAEQMGSIYKKVQNDYASSQILEAKAKLTQRDYKGALDVLINVDPTCNQFKQAVTLVEQIQQASDEKEKEEAIALLKMYEEKKEAIAKASDNEVELKKIQIDASKVAASKELSSQIQQAELSESLKSWFLGKFN